MTEQTTKLSREQLYNEIWEISVSGVAKKYNVPYAKLLKLCKETNIPYPPSGYWTQLNFGKTVTKTPLPESSITEVTLPDNSAPKRSKRTAVFTTVTEVSKEVKVEENLNSEVNTTEESEATDNQLVTEGSGTPRDKQHIYRTVDGKHNIYNREKLYEQVWANPVVDVAAQYGVSDVAIHKICKSLNVPVPPRGYWSKIRAGAKPKKTPLPKTKGVTEIVGARTFEGEKETNTASQPLAFLSEAEREKVLLAAQQIKVSPENVKLHKKITAYKSVVKEWNKNNMRPEGAQKGFNNYYYSKRPPFLAGVISNETLPRVYRILDALFRQVENLGGTVNDDLSLQIRGEYVHFEVSESQDKIKHEITRQEAKDLLLYEDAKRHNTWASEPQIRKYDYVFNGRLRVSIRKRRHFRETDKMSIESRLGDILIALYEESQVLRLEREASEEAERKRMEEERREEERRNRYNEEVERTIALENAALDYERASRIRAYVKAMEDSASQDGMDEETVNWIDWAKKKADWLDPIVAREDELFGKREHEKNEDQKALKKFGQHWW
ncbi:hypothetical protein MFMK1_000810 [Metallumcola ferriviriculae]|uniref:Uncharacterized protein n=1 Tax=Metallumcola ferriviriculae TaxID=3039180 RepID=A0AAU0UMC4_9FIRM|nr:hypothetical protein MFMK1_000810 [Desulfitibacteraceae bacterium MK1]